jgi:DNA-binding transcriptional MerR regulator
MAKSTKIYYSIGEVAASFQVNTSLIRFWEKEFDVLKPKKNKKGNRLFTEADMRNLHTIYNLVKVQGYTLQGAKEALKQNFETLDQKTYQLQVLTNALAFLKDIDRELAQRQDRYRKSVGSK